LVALTVSEAYRQLTTELLAISMLAGALRNLHVHATTQLMVLDRRFGMVARVDGLEVVLCTLASFVGLAGWGLHGAVAGQALGSALTLAYSLHGARQLGLVWPVAETLKIMLASGVMALGLLLLQAPPTLAGLLAACLLGAVLYGLAMALLFSPQLREMLARRQALA
ncbi:MAG: hypothetical protein RJA10_3832, partial [Pseudomonadota bacterium]